MSPSDLSPADSPVPVRRRLVRRAARPLGFAILAALATWGAFRVAAGWAYRNPDYLPAPTPVIPDWCVVIARGPEKQSAVDDSAPHRNSPIGLYRREGERWTKVRDGLVCRSTTTALDPPRPEDAETVRKILEQQEKGYRYGYVSVPEGLFWLIPTTWKTGDFAFKISDISNRDGYIYLDRPQSIHSISLSESGGYTSPTLVATMRMKSEVFLHPTVTRHWSHIDSQGCINLQKDVHADPAALRTLTSDYDRFTGWLDEAGLKSQDSRLLLYIASKDKLGMSEDSPDLPDSIGLPLDPQ